MGFPGKNTGVGCHFLLQGNLPNPGIEPTSPLWDMFSSGLKYKPVFISADLKPRLPFQFLPGTKPTFCFPPVLTPAAVSMDFELAWALWVLSEDS